MRATGKPRPILALLPAGLVFALVLVLSWPPEPGPLSARLSRAAAQSTAAAATGELEQADVRRAISSFTELGGFFGGLADSDPNRHAARFWSSLQANYTGVGAKLTELERRGRVRIGDLGGLQASRIDGASIVIDRDLGGQWPTQFVRNTRRIGGDDWGYISLLSTVLLDELMRLEPGSGRDWFGVHQRRSNFPEPATEGEQDALLRHLSRFWHLKDKYLWVAMPRDAAAEADARRLREKRKVHLISEMMALSRDFERDLGGDWSKRLYADWQAYDRMVGQFTANRGWLAATPSQRAETEATTGGAAETAAVAASTADPGLKRQVAALTTELEASRNAGRQREAEFAGELNAINQAAADAQQRLMAELETSRQEVVALESQWRQAEADLDDAAQSEQGLTADLEASRQTAALLQKDLEAERAASRQGLESLEARLTKELDASRRQATEREDELTAALAASQGTMAALEKELATSKENGAALEVNFDAERATSRQELESLEARLTKELDASRRQADERRGELTAALAASRQAVAALESELEAEREGNRHAVAKLESALIAELQATRQEADRTQQRLLAELATNKAVVAALGLDLDSERAASHQELESLEARLTGDLDASRRQAAEREDELTAALMASQQAVAALETQLESERVAAERQSTAVAELEAAREEAGRAQQRLLVELATSKEIVTALELDLEAEQEVSRQELESLEARLTSDLGASRRQTAELADRLGAELESNLQTAAALRGELANERKAAANLEARLYTELDAGRQTAAALRKDLETAREANRQPVKGGDIKLAVALEASEQTVAALRDQIRAERTAGARKLAGLEVNFAAELTAREQTAAALRGQIEAERLVAQEKIQSLQARRDADPAAAPIPTRSAEPDQQLALDLAASRRDTAQLLEQLALLQVPLGRPDREAWIAAMALSLFVIVGLLATVIILSRQRRVLAAPALAGATTAGVSRATEPEAPAAPSRSEPGAPPAAGPARPEPSPPEPPEPPTSQSLIEALRQDDLPLFERRFGDMTGLAQAQLQRIVYGAGGEDLAIVSRALGLDKLVFASLYLLSRKCRSGGRDVSPQDLSRSMTFYDRITEAAARDVLRKWRADPNLPGVIERLTERSEHPDAETTKRSSS